MQRRRVIGVMGGGSASPAVLQLAESLGRAIAEQGWDLLTGGRAVGVMDAASRGARSARREGSAESPAGLVIGVLPGRSAADAPVSEFLDVAIFTGMGDARNVVNALSCDVVIALPGGAGTLSEVALAVKSGRPIILLGWAGVPTPADLLPGAGIGVVHDVAEAVAAVVAALAGVQD